MMNQISDTMAARFNLPPIRKYFFSERDWYSTFLTQSDYILAKAMESQILTGEVSAEEREALQARAYARSQVNAIDAGTYDGELTRQEVDVYFPQIDAVVVCKLDEDGTPTPLDESIVIPEEPATTVEEPNFIEGEIEDGRHE